MKKKIFYLTRKNRNFKCKVYTDLADRLCVGIYEKVKFFNTTRWKNKADYRVYIHPKTPLETAEFALDQLLKEEVWENQEKERWKEFWA